MLAGKKENELHLSDALQFVIVLSGEKAVAINLNEEIGLLSERQLYLSLLLL